MFQQFRTIRCFSNLELSYKINNKPEDDILLGKKKTQDMAWNGKRTDKKMDPIHFART